MTAPRTLDVDIGTFTLVANSFWQSAGWPHRICAVLFGQHQVYEHLGLRFRVSFWRQRPYLVTVREAKA